MSIAVHELFTMETSCAYNFQILLIAANTHNKHHSFPTLLWVLGEDFKIEQSEDLIYWKYLHKWIHIDEQESWVWQVNYTIFDFRIMDNLDE